MHDYRDRGPALGQAFPSVRLTDQHGQFVDLHEFRAKRRAVVVFYRSAVW